jgi:hypothetical protein
LPFDRTKKTGRSPFFVFDMPMRGSAGCNVATAVAVTIIALAWFVGSADQGACDTTHGSTHCRTANVTGRGTTDDGTRCRTDAGASFRLGAGCEREDEGNCEQYLFHDGFLL